MNGLLLDANVAIWLVSSNREALSSVAIEALEDERNRIVLSAVSIWEIAIKRASGKLEISDRWFASLIELDLEPLPITFTHAHGVESLPPHHRDPFDRLLVSQAATENLSLVTPDRRIAQYDVAVLW